MFHFRFCIVLMTGLLAVPAVSAQAADPGALSPQSRLEIVRKKTKETFAQMQRRWSATQRDKWRECRKQAKPLRRAGHRTRQFLEDCMGT